MVAVPVMEGWADRGGGIMNRGPKNFAQLVPSGEDANPMNRRLPAEVVTRRRPQQKAPKVEEKKEEEEVKLELKAALLVKPEARAKWLAKAFRQIEEGKSSAPELYATVTSRKFSSGLPEKIGRKLVAIVKENLSVFSEKQQRYLKSKDFHLAAQYDAGDSDEEEADAASRAEEMMARCRAFVRENADTFEDRAQLAAESERKASELESSAVDVELLQRQAEEQAAREKAEQAAKERVQLEELKRQKAEKERHAKAEKARKLAEAAAETERKRQLQEEEADSSMLLLERLVQAPVPEVQESAKDKPRHGGLSRSRSISARSSRSRSRRRTERSRKRDRSQSRNNRDRKRRKRDGKKRRRSSSDEA